MERQEITLDDIERRFTEQHLKPYYDWLRQIVTLASGALTLLVGLQGTYIPQHPWGLWLLQLCWLSLACSILSGLVALYGESAIPLDALSNLRSVRRSQGDLKAIAYVQAHQQYSPKSRYTFARRTTFWAFAAAVFLLSLFAVVNIHPSEQELPVLDHKSVAR